MMNRQKRQQTTNAADDDQTAVDLLVVEDLESHGTGKVNKGMGGAQMRKKTRPTDKKKQTLLWQKGRLIGSGGFGKVFLGLDGNSGTLIAGKEFNFNVNESKQVSMLQTLDAEIRMMKRLQHENVVKYIGADKRGSNFYIFMEYVPGGSLRSLLDTYGPLKPRVASNFTRQILRGLGYLHENKVVHRDIKCANLLVNIDGVVKLADFGSAQAFAEACGMHGTPYWMAPECLRQQPNIGWECDIWSLGCTVLEMLTAKPPFNEVGNALKVLQHVVSDEPLRISAEVTHPVARDFIESCLKRDPEQRPPITMLRTHPFVYSQRSESQCSTASSIFAESISGHDMDSDSTIGHSIGPSEEDEDPTLLDPNLKSMIASTAFNNLNEAKAKEVAGPSGGSGSGEKKGSTSDAAGARKNSAANGNPLANNNNNNNGVAAFNPFVAKNPELLHQQDMVDTIRGMIGEFEEGVEIDLSRQPSNNAVNVGDGASGSGSAMGLGGATPDYGNHMEVMTVSSLPPEGCTTMKKVQGLIVCLLISVLAALSVLLATRS